MFLQVAVILYLLLTADTFSVRSAASVLPENPKNFNVDSVRVIKIIVSCVWVGGCRWVVLIRNNNKGCPIPCKLRKEVGRQPDLSVAVWASTQST